ncbi:hypothetical protein I4U23_016422 [Adineta vaga]|nr:hypothetical protein I4U23_016422 [Adineta vaga]
MPLTNLPAIQREMIRYGLSIYLALGLVGNVLNCIMFTRNSYRRTPSSLYLLSLSIFSMMFLMWLLIPSIYALYYSELQTQSVIYCKIRLYIGHILNLYLRYSVVFACTDRYFITRTNIHLRSLSSIKTAKKLLFFMFIIFPLMAIHMPILMDIRNGSCGMIGIYKLVYAIYQLIISGLLPPIFMSIFSILTINSLHQRHHTGQIRMKQSDRALTRMVVVEVIVNIITAIPYSINLLYGALTYFIIDKSTQRLEIESFITYISRFRIYFVGVTPFYVFIFTSKPFRNEFISLFINFFYKYILRQRRIVPIHDQHTTIQTNNIRMT